MSTPGPSSSGKSRATTANTSDSGELDGKDTNLGVSAIMCSTLDKELKYIYCSESITDVLGYLPQELVGKPAYSIIHPEELVQVAGIHATQVQSESTAGVVYLRMRHKEGYWVNICVAYSIVYDRSVATYSRASESREPYRQPWGAREVLEVTRVAQGEWGLRKWTLPKRAAINAGSNPVSQPLSREQSSSTSPQPTVTDVALGDNFDPTELVDLPAMPLSHKRTFFLLDRFTATAKVMWASNDVIVNTHSASCFSATARLELGADSKVGQQHLLLDRPSQPSKVGQGVCRRRQARLTGAPEPRQPRGKQRTPFRAVRRATEGEIWPQGTDESERPLPGQEFIPVEGIFNACSDGLATLAAR